MFLGSPCPSCRLSRKLGRVVGSRSDIPVPSHSAAVSQHCRFSCRLVLSPRLSCRSAGRRAGSVRISFRLARSAFPCRRRRFVLLAAISVPFCQIGSPFLMSPGGAGGNEARLLYGSTLSGSPCRGAWRGFPVHRLRPSRPSSRLNRVARAGRYGPLRHAVRDIISIAVGSFRFPTRRHARREARNRLSWY